MRKYNVPEWHTNYPKVDVHTSLNCEGKVTLESFDSTFFCNAQSAPRA